MPPIGPIGFTPALDSQPEQLRISAAAVAKALVGLDLEPWRHGVLGLTSMGASAHAGRALAGRLGRFGRRTLALDAGELLALGTAADPADSYIFVSEGGKSRETIEAAIRVAGRPRLALTNLAGSPITHAVDASIDLGHGPDSRVYTIGYTATLQAFGILATALDGHEEGDDWDGLAGAVAELIATLRASAGLEAAAQAFATAPFVDVAGSGASLASAAEGALLLRETTRIATATYETYQYLHGPMEPLTHASGCLVFGGPREVALAAYLVGFGVPVAVIGALPAPAGAFALPIPDAPPISRAILEIVAVHVLAERVAALRGLGIDGFLYHQDDTKVDTVEAAAEVGSGRTATGAGDPRRRPAGG